MSRSSSSVHHYLQIEEFGNSGCCEKFHQYIYGCSFTIITGHKLFLGILAENKSIPIMTVSKIQQWVIMSAYDKNSKI